ncbi:DNA polymerase-3 subunit delta' [Hydrobacter penzbergensis]|uniref:DNA polymerase-3 subunit delta n=1 Tax=Hydrobacter penzbergensis TaxID=1235997 RepID=A0A8X8LCH0_9BACT|nr:DNA polymerase III subunit delta' [Hydrobacter penzbergensis]SDX44821.1 DNA polymerase-3 subunit delta' [Hydrobacter penzbergensis]
MQFKDVIGQSATKQHLVEMVEQNRLSHALLFLGREGSGTLPLALAFAQYVVSQPVASPEVADLFGGFTALESKPSFLTPEQVVGESAFQRAEQLIHPDLHFSYPVIPRKSGDKPVSTDYISEWREFITQFPYGNVYDWLQFIGAENKQGNITADECNDIIRKLSLKSFESEYKVLVLWMPEYLGKEGNKLLKLIEEPPPNTLFILVAENDEQILPTILSRCQLVKIPSLENNEVEQALVERAQASVETARQIAGISEGNYREALQLLQHSDEDWQSLLRDWLNATLKGGPLAQVKFTEEVSKLGREKQKQFLRYFNHLLELSVRIKVLGAGQLMMGDNERDFALRLNKIASVSQQQAIIEELDRAAYYIERNANAKMLFQALTIKLYHIIQNKTLILNN